jgi:hypothetical protein
MNPVVRSVENNVAFVDFFDTAIDTRATPSRRRKSARFR